MPLFQKTNAKRSSREQIGIKEVRDGILIMPSNHYCLVLRVSSVNFALMSDDEQDALIETYQEFLNSLTVPLQITIRVREIAIEKYLEVFRATNHQEANEVYTEQIDDYVTFIRSLISNNNIVTRACYITIPFHAVKRTEFHEAKDQLELQASIVARGLEKLGVRSHTLSNIELLEVFYQLYCPSTAATQPLQDQTIHSLNKQYL